MNVNDKQSDLLKTAAKGSTVTFAGVIAGQGLFFLIRVLISRLFGAQYLGLLVIGLTITKFIRITSSIGLGRGGMRFISLAIGSHRVDRLYGIIGTSLIIPLFPSVVMSAMLFLFADEVAVMWFNEVQLVPIFKTFALIMPFETMLLIGLNLSRGFNTTVYSALVENLFIPVSRLVLFFFFFFLGYGFTSIVYAVILSSIFSALFILILLGKQVREKLKETFRVVYLFKKWRSLEDKQVIISYSVPLFLTGVIGIIMRSVDIFMIGRFLDTSAVGIYAAASVIATVLSTLLIKSLSSIVSPLIATQYGRDNIYNIRYLYVVTTRWMFYLSLPCMVGIIIARKYVMSIYGDVIMIEGTMVLVILIIGHTVNCITGVVGNVLSMTGYQKKELLTNTITLIMNIILNLLLIPFFGIIGAAVATSVSLIIVNGVRVVMVYNIYQVQPFTRSLFLLSFAAFIVTSVSFAFEAYSSLAHINLFLAIVATGIIIYMIYIIGFLKDDKKLLGKLSSKLLPTRKRRI